MNSKTNVKPLEDRMKSDSSSHTHFLVTLIYHLF